MKLYIISQSEFDDYDTYDSALVASKSEEDAKTIHPSNDDSQFGKDYGAWASKPENVTARLIGTAVSGTKRGVIMYSFNAG